MLILKLNTFSHHSTITASLRVFPNPNKIRLTIEIVTLHINAYKYIRSPAGESAFRWTTYIVCIVNGEAAKSCRGITEGDC